MSATSSAVSRLVLKAGQELARERVPGELLDVVAAQQQRPLALPAKPPERRLGRLPAVLMLLADRRDRVAQLPLCQLDGHGSAQPPPQSGARRDRPLVGVSTLIDSGQ